jgi:hypothetical protein
MGLILFRILKWTGLIFLFSLAILFLILFVYTHRGSRPWIRTAFPEISDWKSLKIKLSRGPCLGTCPIYEVSINGLGNVTFDGEVHIPSSLLTVHRIYRSKISEPAVHEIFAAFQRAQFFWLYDRYMVGGTDLPINKISISFDGHKKEVVDYMGRAARMPKEVTDLERKIDTITAARKLLGSVSVPPPVEIRPPEPPLVKAKIPKPSPPRIVIEETGTAH